jgi:probable HAF family extracellular repeat protein
MSSQRTFALGLLLVCLIQPLAEAQHYTITDLGPLAPTAINIWGQVVGNYNGHAFIWTRTGGMRNLGTLPGGIFSSAIGINDLGVVAGSADGPAIVSPLDVGSEQCSNLIQPFVWTLRGGMRTAMQPIPPPTFGASNPCYSAYYATGINALGQVVGYHTPYGTYQHAFLWTSADGITLFGGSWPPTLVNGVNNAGEMVGQNSEMPDPGIGHATWWKDGVPTALAELGSEEGVYYSSSASGVNDQGQVVGWSTTLPLFLDGCDPNDFATYAMHAVLWTRSGAILDLGTLPGDTISAASKITFFGQVIGSSGIHSLGRAGEEELEVHSFLGMEG